jgi:hypothetical protein
VKALCLVTITCNCEILARSVEAAGHECLVELYTNGENDRHLQLVEIAKAWKPDFISYIGAISGGTLPVPSPDILCALNAVAPMIHLCGDACDSSWWDWLHEYDRRQCFTVQVSMDGSPDNPILGFKNGISLLSPVDCRPFFPRPWSERSIRLGLVGGYGHSLRANTISALLDQGLLSFTVTHQDRSYAEMARIMCDTRVTLNNADNGTGNRRHVKGRVIEAGFAGSCLLETRGSPTADWFAPGYEFLEYDDANEVMQILNDRSDDDLRSIAGRFHARMVREHHPRVFWDKVLHKAGLC